jgi:hypothetical protein
MGYVFNVPVCFSLSVASLQLCALALDPAATAFCPFGGRNPKKRRIIQTFAR